MRQHAPAGSKYTVQVHRRAPDAYSLDLGSSSVDAVTRILTDGSLLVQVSCCLLLQEMLLSVIKLQSRAPLPQAFSWILIMSMLLFTQTSRITGTTNNHDCT